MTRLVHLQGYGKLLGTQVSELSSGDVLMWNYGYKSTVVSVTPVTASTYVLVERTSDGKEYTRRKRATTLVVRVDNPGMPV